MSLTRFATLPDALTDWITAYRQLALHGIRSTAVEQKIALHLQRFRDFFHERYGHEHICMCLRRDVLDWRTQLQNVAQFAPTTINNHLASLSGFTTWVHTQAPRLFANGDPVKGLHELAIPPLEPRALTDDQVRSLKNLCDRLPRLYELRGRAWADAPSVPLHPARRPFRDRALVFVLLSTGLRREELIRLDLVQLEPVEPPLLRDARRARFVRVQGKGNTERRVFLSADARTALADYLEYERPVDANEQSTSVFLSAAGLPARANDGRLSPRAINLILTRIGHLHDNESQNPERKLSPLHPHALRHTFAFRLAQKTGADAYELERRLGHRSQRYISRYTNPPENIAASYIEEF